MPIIVACPSCGSKLRIADALVGQRVRCPACNHIFHGDTEPAPPPSPAAPIDLPLDLSLDDPSSSSPPVPPRDKGGLFGAIELKPPSDDEPDTPPPPPAATPRRPPPLRDERQLDDWEVPDLRRRGPRRDAEPDRGAVVLTLGIISLAGTVIYCVAPLWAILGLVAWIMGQTDLRKMKRGQMDDRGRGMTQAGWICGILGVVFNGLLTLLCGGFIGVMWYNEMSRPPNTRPFPMTPPPKMVPPNNPPLKKF